MKSFPYTQTSQNNVAWLRLSWVQRLGVGWVEERNPIPHPSMPTLRSAHAQIRA